MPVVDLKFMVHNHQQIKDATKSLLAFNTANVQRAANYDKVAAADIRGMTATAKLNRMKNKLQSDLIRLEREGILSKEQLIQKEREYNAMLVQEERTLKNFVETDRTLIAQEKRKQKMVDESIKKTEKQSQKVEKLKKQYSSSYAALQRYRDAVDGINLAWGGDKTAEGRQALKALRKDYDDFTNALKRGSIVDAGNQFARYGDQAYRATQKTKRFASVGLQQAGYQVNDFIVQIASGQNALVAFGQQGSQLAGIFGTGGAVVGAIIAGIAALGNLVYQTYRAEKAVEDLSEAFDELSSKISGIQSMGGQLENVLKAPMSLARYELSLLLKEMRAIDLKDVREEISQTFGVQSQSRFNKLIGQHVPIVGKVVIQKEGILADMQEVLAEMQGAEALARAASSGKIAQHAANIGQLNKDINDLATALAAPIKSEQDLITLGYELNKITKGRKGLLQDQVRLFMTSTGIMDLMVDQQVEAAETQAEADKAAAEALERKRKLALQMRQANAKHLEQEQKAIEDANAKEVAHLNKIYAFNQRITNQITASNKKREDYDIAKMKTEGDLANARDLEIRQANTMAFNKAMAGHEALKLTGAEFNTMQALAVEAGKAAEEAVRRKHASEDATQAVRDGLEDARELAKALEDAARATEIINSLNFNVEDKIAVMRAKIHAFEQGGDGQAAGQAVSGYLRAKRLLEKSAAGEALSPAAEAELAQNKVFQGILYDLTVQYKDYTKAKKNSSKKEESDVVEDLAKEAFALDWSIKKREALVGLTEEETILQTIKMQLFDKAKDKIEALDEVSYIRVTNDLMRVAKVIAAEEERVRALEKAAAMQKEIAETMASTFADNFMSIVDGTKSVADAFKAMAADIVKHLFKVLVIQTMIRAMGGFMGSVAAPDSLMGNIGKGLLSYEAANGGVMNNGQVVPYANGGVVQGPTQFPMSGGRTGLMGEAGPEAIMPLHRGKDGKLGVQADGGSSSNVVIHQSFNFSANGDESVKKIIAEQAPAIANMTKQNILNDRRRGGQMRQAFG
tara:strand:+ start:4683 stop:7766 length:3084 start_codon:yes stop_codon:yes gene_type:complete